ncbi:MAG TPA: C25 family cysteine peptidase [Candidatus Krumholzibacteria bacterium]|nr:C25 family cysteine peptidase [Candidatus Krumholzibacteria bacterium]
MTKGPVARLLALCCTVVSAPFVLSTPAHADRLTYTVSLPGDPATVSHETDGDRIALRGSGWDVPRTPGATELPRRTVRIVLPQGQEVDTFSFTFSGETRMADTFAPAAAGDLVGTEGERVTAPSRTRDASQRVEYLGTGTLCGYQVASFAVYPFGTDSGSLRRASDVELRIDTRPLTSTTAARVRHRDGWRESVRQNLEHMVVNPEALSAYAFTEVVVPETHSGFTASTYPSLEGSPVDYVIVTNDSLAAAYQVLADWKTSKGVPTVVRTTEWIAANYRNGSDMAETIRNFVKDAYSLWGIKYLLLGGDVAQIPVRMAYSAFYPSGVGSSIPVDMYFGCLDGDWNADHDAVFGEFGSDNADLWAEVYVGRLPTRNNAEVNLMVGKVKNYETPVNTTYEKKILMLGEVLFPSNYHPGDTITLNGADLAEYIRLSDLTAPGLSVARNYETYSLYPGSLPETRQAAIDSLNTGYNHVVHIGHGFRFNMSCGDASLVNADADGLTNGVKLSNMNLLNCTACAYTYECLAEHFLRVVNGGAVSVVGSNDSAFPTVATDYLDEYYDLLFNQNVVHIGEAFARSREARTAYAEASDAGDRWTHFTYTLLADPEMPLWTGPVSTMAVAFPSSVNKGTNSITVTVTKGGNPLQFATVCLSKGSDDYKVGTTNALGQATLSFRAESAGTIDVVVTALNCKRYEGTITVGGTGAYLAINSITIDDDNTGGTSGNGNGVIDGGETVDLGFSLKNNGTATSGSVSVVLRAGTAGVTVVDSTAAGTTIAAGATQTMTGGCRVSFASSLTDQQAIPFTLIIKNNGIETWRDTFKKLVHEPNLSLVKLRIDDTGTGNGDGVVQAGEQFKLFYKVKNFGTGAYPGGTMTAYDLDGAFTIGGGGTSAYASIPSLGSIENTTGFTLTESSVATEHRLRLRLVDLFGRAYEDTVELRPPGPPTNIVIDPSIGPDRLQLTWSPSPSTDVMYYNVYRSLSGAGPFTQVNVDPVPHTLFMNTGLSPTTTYYYKATAVDVSGNESAMSAVYSGSTNPAQLAGWPIAMESETVSSVAVGDIDGDGGQDIVVGDKYVYAWHANGIELIDGDSNPLSWGVLSTQGQSYVGHVALARMDGTKGLDIVAASRDTKQVYIFRYDGTVLPGWPRPVENNIRAGVAVGDINNDNLFEVVAIDELGVLYVWKSDGTEYRDGDSNPATQGVFARLTGCSLQYSVPALADIDGDGKDEIIVGTQGNQLFAFNDDGTNVPGFPVALSDDIAGSPAVGDVDGNGSLEIVVNIKDGHVRCIKNNGTDLWSRTTIGNTYFFAPSPAIGDVTGDGKLETFVPTYNGKLYGLTSTGADLPGFPTTYSATTYTESSPVIADIDGDGLRDVLIGSEEKKIWAWNRNGVVLAGFPLTTGDAMRSVPTVTDVDGDGKVDIVAAGWDKNVYVWHFNSPWNPANAPWPRFHANLHNNGRVGYLQPTPVAGTRFAFTLADNRINLEWNVPVEAGRTFDVYRAPVQGGTTGVFQRIARGVNATPDGRVQVSDTSVEMGDEYVYRLSGETGVVHETGMLYVPVSRAALGQNYPNPFNPTTKIDYWVPDGARSGAQAGVSLIVYDVRGARVRTLVSGPKDAGRYVAVWDGRDDAGSPVSSGIYFYRMTAPGFATTRKMVLLK